MNSYDRTARAVGAPLAFAIALLLLVLVPAGASAAPQGRWVLPATDLSVTGQTASTPQIVIAPDGSAIVVWSRSNGSNTVIQAATRPPGGGFSAPVNLSAAGQDATDPQLAIAPDGSAVVVWSRSNGSNTIIQAATRPPGGVFGAPVNLSTAGQDATDPQVAIAADDSVTAVWSRSDGSSDIVQAATRSPGGAFTTALSISSPGQYADRPQVAIAADGSATVVWYRINGANSIIQAATRPLGGGFFTVPVDLSATGQDAYDPQVAIGPDGSTTVVWRRSNGANFIIEAATRPPGGVFETPVSLSATGQDADSTQVAIAADGSTTVVWERYDGTDYIIQTATRPPGGAFGAAVDLSATGQNADQPQVAIAPDGSTTVVWSVDTVDGSTVQAATRPPGGAFGAAEDLSTIGQDAYDPQVAIAPDGSATTVWQGQNNVIQSASTARHGFTLSLTRSGTGQGKITSSPNGINCGTGCSKSYAPYTKITLTATAKSGSSFSGWSGACSGGHATCVVTMLEATSVNAKFRLPTPSECKKATLELGKFKSNRRRGTGTLKVKVGAAGKVTLNGSKTVAKSAKQLNRNGTVTLKVRATGKAARQLRQKGSVKLKLKVSFQPGSGCKTKIQTRKVKLAN